MCKKKAYENCGKNILDKRELVRLLESGVKRADIARVYGVTRGAVTRAAQRLAA